MRANQAGTKGERRNEPADGFGIDGYSLDAPAPVGIGGFVEGGREEGRVITFHAGQPCGPG